MAERTLSGAIRNASAVNLKYSADLLNLGRDYVRAFTAALSEEAAQPDAGGAAPRPPLLLAGRAGETANAAFAIGNNGKLKGTLTLSVLGDFGDSKVSVEPERLAFDEAGGEGEITVRILAKIGRKTEAGADATGSVVIPELDHKVTDFVVRKLPG